MRIQFKKILLLLIFLLSIEHLTAQTPPAHVRVDSINNLFKDLDLDTAEQLIDEALKLSIESGYVLGEADARSNLGVIHYRKGNHTKAIEQYFAAIKLYETDERLKNTYNYGLTFLRLASAFDTVKDDQRAITYLHKAISIAHTIKDTRLLALVYEEFGNNYNSRQQFDSALHYYKKAKEMFQQVGAFKNIVSIENNTGIIYYFKGDYKQAIAHYSLALANNQKSNKHFYYVNINGLYNIGEGYYMLKSYNKALHYLDSAQVYAQTYKTLGNLLDIYLLKAKTFQLTNRLDSAAHYYESTIALKDSIYDDNYKKELAALQTQSDVYKKETENKLLTKDKRIAELYRNLAIAGIVGLIILLGFILVNQRLRIQRRVKNQLEEEVALRTKEIFQQKETIFHTNLQLKLAVNSAQFDSAFAMNMLTAIQEVMVQQSTAEAQTHLAKLASLMQYVLEKSPLERVPLQEEVQMIEHYIQLEQLRLQQSFQYNIALHTSEHITLPAQLLQPFVANAIEEGIAQAAGTKLHLQLERKGEELLITITDNGTERSKKRHSNSYLPGSSIGRERLDLLTHLTHKNHLMTMERLTLPDGTCAGNKILLQIPIDTPAILEEPTLRGQAASVD